MLCSLTKLLSRSRAAQAVIYLASAVASIYAQGTHAETLGSYYHTSFLKQDGAPTDIGGLAQTSDGFLWISGAKGLTRYDGNSFSAFHTLPGENFPETQLDDLFPAEGGGLWIARDTNGVTLLKDGHLAEFGSDKGYLGAGGNFISDTKGHVWSYTTDALMRFDKGSWHVVYQSSSGHDVISHANFDNDGNLWAIVGNKLFVLPEDGTNFIKAPNGPEGALHVFSGGTDHLYVLAKRTELHIYRRHGLSLTEEAKPVFAPIYTVLESRSGAVWMGSTLQGLYYISSDDLAAAESAHTSPSVQHLTQSDGLTSDFVVYIMEDTEGDIWLVTSTGLDRFRRAAFTRIDLPRDIHSVSASVDHLGNLWVGSETNPLLFRQPSGELRKTAPERLTQAMYVDPRDQSAWAANVKGVWRLVPGAPRLERPLTSKEVGFASIIPCMLRDSQGAFYVCTPYNGPGNGLLVSDNTSWKEVFNHPVYPLTLAIDAKDNIWVSSKDPNRLYRLSNGTQTLFSEKQGLAVGIVRSIYANGDVLWVGGDAGIQFFARGRFVTLLSDHQEIMGPASGLLVDRHGDLWAQTLDGVLRIRAADIRNFRRGILKQVHQDLFDDADGIPGDPTVEWTNPTLRMSPDGKIWAQTLTGLAWVDPDHIPTSNKPPVVYVDGLDAEGHNYSLNGDDIRLPPNRQALRISYTSPSFNRPEKITFRYRLVGMSDAWQDAGDRREATFTNIPAGTYRFEVIAINGDGLSSTPASIDFKQLPAYYETWWFRSLFVLPVALLLWLAYRMPTRALARRLKIRSEEREAIARDIHDSLLQRMHAVMLSLKRLSRDEAAPSTFRDALAQVCEETHDAIIEGRGRILALRRDLDAGLVLYDQLMAEGRRLQNSGDAHFTLEVRGAPRKLKSGPQIELRDIAIEAMRNAFAHSGASKVIVTLNFEDQAFWLIVSDNGVGFCAAATDQAHREGHFGIVGMRERAAALKGSINIDSSPEEGTEVHIRVPARVIYVNTKSLWNGSSQTDDDDSTPIATSKKSPLSPRTPS
jgi:signal transduction histidine kinase/ligand-binding sensor domain-containing protein